MKINLTNIKAYLGITDISQDVKISMLIQQTVSSICAYCNRYFTDPANRECGTMIFNSDGTITIPLNIEQTYTADDFIVISRSYYNNGLYQLESVEGNVLTIKENYELQNETSGAYINKCIFPPEILGVVAGSIKNCLSTINSNVKRETIDDVTLEYFEDRQDKTILNQYRKVYREEW